MATRFFKPKIDKYIQLYSKYAYVEEGTRGTGRVKSIEIQDGGFLYDSESTDLKPTVIISAPDEEGGVQATAVVADVDENHPRGVLKINVTNEGSGYLYPPTVTVVAPSLDGDNDDTNDGITYIYTEEGNYGSGYASGTTTVTISPPDTLEGVQATATPVITNGVITGIEITNIGFGYNFTPTVTISPPFLSDGVQATAIVTGFFVSMGITSIEITEGGSGYIEEPTIFISPPDVEGGVQATATPVIENGSIMDVTITNPGSGYTNIPTAEIKGGYGSGAILTLLMTRGFGVSARATIGFDAYVVAKKYVWELNNPVVVNENALIQVVDRQFTGIESADIEKPIVIRMHELSSKSVVNTQNRSRFNDSFYTGNIIDVGKPDRKLPNDIKLEIQPQNIHRISLSLNQGISDESGISTNIEFVIILKITEKEPTMLEYGSLNNINVNQI